ncbi:hypothetical protein BDW69DRAFT_111529 [Aspergillus filifer]
MRQHTDPASAQSLLVQFWIAQGIPVEYLFLPTARIQSCLCTGIWARCSSCTCGATLLRGMLVYGCSFALPVHHALLVWFRLALRRTLLERELRITSKWPCLSVRPSPIAKLLTTYQSPASRPI